MMNPRLCAGFMIPGEIKCTARVLSPPCCLIMELAPCVYALCAAFTRFLPKAHQPTNAAGGRRCGSLSDIVLHRRRLREDHKLTICRNVAQAMLRLHFADFLHADLKPSNVLVMDISTWWLKLADFGLSAHAFLSGALQRCHVCLMTTTRHATSHFNSPSNQAACLHRRETGRQRTEARSTWAALPLRWCRACRPSPRNLMVRSPTHPFAISLCCVVLWCLTRRAVFSFGLLMWEVFAQRKPFGGMSDEQISHFIQQRQRCAQTTSSDRLFCAHLHLHL